MNWKKITGILVGVFVLVLAGAAIFLMTYDYNALKPRLESMVKAKTGRELTLAGDISLNLGLTPSLTIDDVALANAAWGSDPEMASIGEFELQVALLPLFKRQIEIQRVVLNQVSLLVEKNAQGRSNLDLQPQGQGAAQGGKGPEAKAPKEAPTGPALPGLSLDKVRVKDCQLLVRDAQGVEVTSVLIKELDLSGQGQQIALELKGRFNQQDFELSGSVGGLSALSDPKQPWPVDLELTAGTLSGQIKGQIRDLSTKRGLDLDLAAEVKDPKGLRPLLKSSLPLVGPLRLTTRLKDTGNKSFQARPLEIVQGENRLSGGLDLRLGQPLSVDLKLHGPRLDLTGIATAKSKPGSSEPGSAQDQGQAQGPKSKAKVQAQGQPDQAKVFSDRPLPWQALQGLDAKCELGIKTMATPKLTLQDFDLQASLQDGLLKVSRLRAKSSKQGELRASLKADSRAKDPKVALQAKVTEFDLGQVLRNKPSETVLEGPLDARVDLLGQGRSLAGIMASLDGKLQASLGRGRLANSKLEALGADLGASLFRLVNPVQRRQDFTVINCAVLIVPVKSGLAEIKAFVLDTPRMTVKGQGQIDLGRETLDIGLDPRPKEGLKTGALGKLSLSFSELARAFRLSGHLANPSLALDKTKALETLGKGIGGALLSGPTGLAAGLLGSSEEGGNPCLEALQGKDSQSGPKKDSPESGSKDINKGLKELEKGLQGLF